MSNGSIQTFRSDCCSVSGHRAQEEAHKQEEEAKKAREQVKDGQRKSAYLEAQRRQSERVSSILSKSAQKQQKLDSLKSHQDHDNAKRALERRLDLDLKWEKVIIVSCAGMIQECHVPHVFFSP